MNFDFSKQIDFFKYEWESLTFIRKVFFNKAMINAFLYKIIIPEFQSGKDIYFFKTMHRDDYDNFMKLICEDLKSYSIVPINRKFSFNISVVKYRVLVKQIWLEAKELPIFCRLYALFSILKYLNVIDEVVKIDTKLVVVHAEMQPIENLVAQVFKNKKTKTVTLQHGLYVDYSLAKNINVVNYENVATDYFISWGDETKKLIKKYNSTEVIIGGAPHLLTNIESDALNDNSDFFTVIFDQNMFYNENVKLLSIANLVSSRLGLKLNVRLHPRNNIHEYNFDVYNVVFGRDIYNSRFVLAHTTSLSIELMYFNIPVYILRTQVPRLFYPESIMFSCCEELLIIHENCNVDFRKQAQCYVGLSGKNSILKYKCIFNDLLQ